MQGCRVYSIGGYGSMIADRIRVAAYTQALRQAVQSSSVVLDLGTGTGFFAMLACQLGARRVIAVEPDDAIQVAQAHAVANGYANRIEFIQDFSTNIHIPEPADVIVSDLRGVLPLMEQHLPTIADARKRLLAPGGVLIPQLDTLWAAPINDAQRYQMVVAGYESNEYGFNLDAARQHVTNCWCKAHFTPEQLLAEASCWAKLDYTVIEDASIDGRLTWSVTRPGVGHGLAVWFDSILASGVNLSNAPSQPELIYGNAFFPWSKPVAVEVGDRIDVVLKVNRVSSDYVWRWDTRVIDPEQPDAPKAVFAQSTFFGVPHSPTRLRKKAAEHRPQLSENGVIDQFILGLMDGKSTVGDLARRVQEHFPRQFAQWHDALTRVTSLSEKYSR